MTLMPWYDDETIPEPQERRASADELDGLAERMRRTDDYLAALVMVIVMVMIGGAWLVGAGWRP